MVVGSHAKELDSPGGCGIVALQMHALLSLVSSLPTSLFVTSGIMLCCGLLGKVWADAVRLSFLDTRDLRSVEREHPYLPSLRIIAGVAVCTGSLLAVALTSLTGRVPFHGPDAWMYLAALFALLGSAGILAEMRWGAGDYVFAVTLGTAVAFLLLVLQRTAHGAALVVTLSMVVQLLSTCIAGYFLFFQSWSRRVRWSAVVTLAFWLVLFNVGK
jgi:hypothetical protein